jgi:hypothetical protein
MVDLEQMIFRTACIKYNPIMAWLKINEVREKYYVKHKPELYVCKTCEEVHAWKSKEQLTVFRLFMLYTRDVYNPNDKDYLRGKLFVP